MTILELQIIQHTWVERRGWHNKTRLEYLALLASEVGEAINEARNTSVNEAYYYELADIALRLFDLAEVEGINLEEYILQKIALNENRLFINKEK
jgi:NTP pyrophosphatase (non-canonical NTP hydrolase)